MDEENRPKVCRPLISINLIYFLLAVLVLAVGLLAYQNIRLSQEVSALKSIIANDSSFDPADEIREFNNSQEEEIITVNLGNDQESLDYLKNFGQVIVFFTQKFNDIGSYGQYTQKLYLADNQLTRRSLKEVFVWEDSVEVDLTKIERLAGDYVNYFIAQFGGVNTDMAIFTKDGEVVAKSVRQANPGEEGMISFDSYNFDNQTINAVLFYPHSDADPQEVEIDPATARIITPIKISD